MLPDQLAGDDYAARRDAMVDRQLAARGVRSATVLDAMRAVLNGVRMDGTIVIGEGASKKDTTAIRNAINANGTVESLIYMKTLYLGPDELLVAAKVAFAEKTSMTAVSRAINDVERDIRSRVPIARVIFIEPDVYRERGELPPTDAIVIKGND